MQKYVTLCTYYGLYRMSKYIWGSSKFAFNYGWSRANKIKLALNEKAKIYEKYGKPV